MILNGEKKPVRQKEIKYRWYEYIEPINNNFSLMTIQLECNPFGTSINSFVFNAYLVAKKFG